MPNHLTPILDSLRPLSEDCILNMAFERHPTVADLNDLFLFSFAFGDKDCRALNPATGHDLFREWQIIFACFLAEMSGEDLQECFPEIFSSPISKEA
jgi:hypothetical protein